MIRSALRLTVLLASLGLVALVAACGGSTGPQTSTEISVVGHSAVEGTFQEIVPTFSDSAAGQGIKVKSSFGAIEEQARAVGAARGADVVLPATEADMTELVEQGVVDRSWKDNPFEGLVARSLVTFVVRKDNPKRIRGWSDLMKPGVKVVAPDPSTSGAGRWAVMAAYGSQTERGRSAREGETFLRRLFGNAETNDRSAPAARRTFTGGKGDVLITYESEAIAAQEGDAEVDYVTPPETILVEHPVAVVAKTKRRREADQFLEYLRETQTQKVFADQGFRAIDTTQVDEDKYPRPARLFTIDDVGGWERATRRFFAPDDGVVSDILKR